MAEGSRGPSRTARFVALFRALETRLPEDERLFADPFAADFLDARLGAALAAARLPGTGPLVPAYIDRRWPGTRVSVVVRTRFIDQALEQAVDDGVGQVVLLGAGFDARAYRLDAAKGSRVYEVDAPETQALKRAAIEARLGSSPANVAWVAVDFERDDLAASLGSAGLDPEAPAFFVWEGVTPYLTADAVDATLRAIASVAAPSSRLVFTYLDRAGLEGAKRMQGAGASASAAARVGEPFQFGLDPTEVPAFLAERGFELVEQATSAELAARFLHPLGRRPPVSPFYNVVLAARQGG